MSRQCEYKYSKYDHEVPCPRDAGQRSHCILHRGPSNTTPDEFRNELQKELSSPRDGVIDLREIYGPNGATVEITHDIDADIDLRGAKDVYHISLKACTVKGDVKLNGIRNVRSVTITDGSHIHGSLCLDEAYLTGKVLLKDFNVSGQLCIRNASIKGDLWIEGAVSNDSKQKLSSLDISDSSIHNVTMFNVDVTGTLVAKNTKMTGNLHFNGVDLRGDSHFELVGFGKQARFMSTNFLSNTSFEETLRDATVELRGCNLGELRLLSFGRELKTMTIDDCTWPKTWSGLFRKRRYLADENDKGIKGDDKKRLDLLQAYRFLHEKHFNASQFGHSSDFYIGFMVARRKAFKRIWVARLIDTSYAFLSQYGESVARPFFCLLLLWLCVPVLLLALGVPLDPPARGQMDIPMVKVEPVWQFTSYLKAVALNLSLTTLVRSNELRPAVTSLPGIILLFETFLNLLFGGFLALGIRRTFNPKKPIGQ